jgi:4-hydroxybenzoate polyprenyltransferase
MNVRNVLAYFKERFPPVNMMLFCILFLTVYSVARYFHADVPAKEGWHLLLGVAATISFFYRLRVFDEIKDFQLDRINHPQRVLQSGRVSLQQLMTIAAVLALSEIAWSLLSGMQTLFCWLVAVGYSLLMRYEFFVSGFLKKRLFLYAFTHMLIMPFVIVWIWSAYAEGLSAGTGLLLLSALSIIGGFSFEIARKIHAPAAERALVDSYSKSLGFKTAIFFVLAFLLTGIAVQFYLLRLLQARTWPYVLLSIFYLGTLFLYTVSIRQPDEKRLRMTEVLVSLFMLISYLSIIIEIRFH